jgi:hypothetical protein
MNVEYEVSNIFVELRTPETQNLWEPNGKRIGASSRRIGGRSELDGWYVSHLSCGSMANCSVKLACQYPVISSPARFERLYIRTLFANNIAMLF